MSEPVRPVTFESSFAETTFRNQIEENSSRKSDSSKFSFGIPFLLGLSYETRLSDNAYYNDWATRIDTDGDGLITDAEVAWLNSSDVPQDGRPPTELPPPLNAPDYPIEIISEREAIRDEVRVSYDDPTPDYTQAGPVEKPIVSPAYGGLRSSLRTSTSDSSRRSSTTRR